MNMKEMLEQKLARFEELDRMLVDPEVLTNSVKVTDVARERGSLAKLATKYKSFKRLNQEIAEANELAEAGEDAEMREMAAAELPRLREQRETLYDELLDMTIGGEDANRSRSVMEIRAGTGGEEAALFARDLYEMYKHFAETRGWKVEVMDLSPTELGGFKEIVLSIEGEDAYRVLQYESGGHRVQRVPETEAKGRIHTSAATVAVLPEPEDVEVELKADEYDVERYAASSGPGGQHVNKTASAVRLTHHATGIVVRCSDERSQHKNLSKALRHLKSRIYDFYRQKEQEKRSHHRKTLVGSGDRSQRIRTYNFPENRVTDHRINLTLYKLDNILAGNLSPVSEALIDFDRQQQREDFGTME